MPEPTRPPGKVAPGEARVREETQDGGFRVGVVIDRASHGSPLLQGLEWIEPGTEPVSWEADAKTHETYYVVRGRVRISWRSPSDSGSAELVSEDSFYFPPGRRYTAENSGAGQAFIVWALTPSP